MFRKAQQRRRAIAYVTAAVVAGAGVGAFGLLGNSGAAVPSMSEAQISSMALSFAAQAGDPSPSLIQHSVGTRAQANEVAGGEGVPGNNTSELIAEKGHFVDNSASVPPGQSEPSGTVLTLVVDQATGTVTDVGLTDTYPALATLGSGVVTDSGSVAQSIRLRRALRSRIHRIQKRSAH